MNIRVLLVLLAISVLLACTQRWRRAGLIASGVLAALLVWFIVRQPTPQEEATAPASSVSSAAQDPQVPPIVALQLEGGGAPWRLSGTIANQGATPIRYITLQVERFDCPAADSPESDCTSVWRGQHTIRMRIAANATIKIDESFYSHAPVPRLKGVVRDRINVASLQ